MADFTKAVERLLRLEGGDVDHPADRGGRTKFGISSRQYPDLDIKSLTREQAIAIYRQDYWQDTFNKIPNQMIADKLFDGAVNMGPARAVTLLQRALNDTGSRVTVDGRFGPQTLMAVRLACQQRTKGMLDAWKGLLDAWRARIARHYVDLVMHDHTQLVFLDGWLRRAVG